MTSSPELKLEVVWESSSDLVAKIMAHPETPLRDIHRILVRNQPELLDEDFMYMLNGKPVFREFWEVVKAKHLMPFLILREGNIKIEHRGADRIRV